MLVYVQWAKADPGDYEAFDLTRIQQVRNLPKKPPSATVPQLDNVAGWIADVVVQGVSFAGWDHLSAAFPGGTSLQVIAWNDDPVDYPDGPWGQVWTFHDPAPDPRYGGQVNTRQELTVYTDVPAQVAYWTGQTTSMGPVVVRPWAEFPTPQANLTLHGVWIDDALYELHRQRRTLHGWREWVR